MSGVGVRHAAGGHSSARRAVHRGVLPLIGNSL